MSTSGVLFYKYIKMLSKPNQTLNRYIDGSGSTYQFSQLWVDEVGGNNKQRKKYFPEMFWESFANIASNFQETTSSSHHIKQRSVTDPLYGDQSNNRLSGCKGFHLH